MSDRVAPMELVVDGVVYQSQSSGGVSRVFSEILPRMCEIERALVVTLFTEPTWGMMQEPPRHPRILHRRAPRVEPWLRPSRLWKPAVPRARALARRLWLGRGRGKIWHSTYFTAPPPAWSGASVVTVYDAIHERFPQLFTAPADERLRERKRRCIEAADHVICISAATGDDVRELYGVDPARLSVVPLACSDLFGPGDGAEPDARAGPGRSGASGGRRPFLLYVGDRSHYKDFGLLLSAFARWPRRGEVELRVAGGGGWTDAERARLAGLGLAGDVRAVGRVSDLELRALYREAAALVHPSLYEGFGIPLLEAMACGCPVVASRIPSTLEVAGDCPAYFDPGEADGLIDALDTVLDEGRAPERREAGLRRARGYSWDATARATLDVYRGLAV